MLGIVKKNIFICSTVKNLKYIRQIITDYIQRCGHIALANELPEFPVHGNLHPMDECLEIIRRKATHFILIIGKKWGLPYYKKRSLSITEKEFFTAAKKKIPVLCFIEEDTWNEARTYHEIQKEKPTQSASFSTDLRVLEFIDKHLMHNNITWITPFSHFDEILRKLAFSWLVCQTKPYRLFLVKHNDEAYYNAIDDYTAAFVSFLLNQSLLPIPQIDLPEKDKKYIAAHRVMGRKVDNHDLIDPFDSWIKAFEEICNKLNLALKTSYRVILKGKTEKYKDDFSFYYPRDFKKVIRLTLESYLDFAKTHIYGHEARRLPNIEGFEFSIKPTRIKDAIHSIFGCNENEIILRLNLGIGHDRDSLRAYIPLSTFERWESYCCSEYFSKYNKFLVDWATVIIPQVIAFQVELSDYIIEKVILNFDYLMGVRIKGTEPKSVRDEWFFRINEKAI